MKLRQMCDKIGKPIQRKMQCKSKHFKRDTFKFYFNKVHTF